MKKTIKMIITMMLVVATMLPMATTAQAATTTNKWLFQAGKSKKTVYVGQATRLTLSNSISGSTVNWTSSNKKVATVDSLGNVTGKKAGTATVTADDGTHTATFTVTVKAISKAKSAQLNYDGIYVEYGKTYTIKSLNGSAVKKITNAGNSKVTISGTKVTPKCNYKDQSVQLLVTLKDGTKVGVSFPCVSSKEKEEAISIVEKAASEAGVSTSSSDLEKAMFIYNWLGENCSYSLSTKTGHYYAIRTGKGNCSAYSEAVQLMGEVLGLQVVRVQSSNHECNGVCVNGKWYLMDTTQCTAWDFVYGGRFLISQYRQNAISFKVSSGSLTDITFDNTEYDDCSVWAEYKSNYVDPIDDDFWNS